MTPDKKKLLEERRKKSLAMLEDLRQNPDEEMRFALKRSKDAKQKRRAKDT